MNNPQNSSRISTYQSSFASSVQANNIGFDSADMPLATPHRDFGVSGPSATDVEFKARAKLFKRSQIKRRIVKKLIIFSVILGLILVALGSVGFALNRKYSGRALPYSYIGEISIGGLTAAEIKNALDLRAKGTMVTFTEAGLTRTVPLSTFTAEFDTKQASQNALVGFNPFNYLTKRNFTVPVTVNSNQVDGYLRLNVANKQTKSVNAEIIKGKEELVILPEVYGFRTSTDYVTGQLEEQLAEMKDPVVSLTAAAERPKVTEEDLKDDIEKANAMVGTDIAVQVWNTKLEPSVEDKLGWLEISDGQGTTGVNLQFSRTSVREYIFGLATKYEKEQEDEKVVTNADGSQSIQGGKRGGVIKNKDEVAGKFYAALISQQNGLFEFEFEYKDYLQISREGLVLATAPAVAEVAADEDAEAAIESESPGEEEGASEPEPAESPDTNP